MNTKYLNIALLIFAVIILILLSIGRYFSAHSYSINEQSVLLLIGNMIIFGICIHFFEQAFYPNGTNVAENKAVNKALIISIIFALLSSFPTLFVEQVYYNGIEHFFFGDFFFNTIFTAPTFLFVLGLYLLAKYLFNSRKTRPIIFPKKIKTLAIIFLIIGFFPTCAVLMIWYYGGISM